MNTRCCILAAAALLISAPAMAQQVSGGGSINVWSGAQGTSFSYGGANGFGNSSSGALFNIGNLGTNAGGFGGGTNISGITTSSAGTSSVGSGYAQAQTSGYAGGSVSGFVARSH